MGKELDALWGRWEAFAGKVEQRLHEIQAEAEAGFDQMIEMQTTDLTPLQGAATAVHSRLLGLQSKVSDAFDKLDDDLDTIADSMGNADAAYRLRDQLIAAQEALCQRIELADHELVTRKKGQAVRKLFQQATQEMQAPVYCSQCGADLAITIHHRSSNVTCTHCGAVNTARPGPATLQFFQAGGVHLLAEEAAQAQWAALQHEEQRFHDLRHPTEEDFQRLEQATTAYWRTYVTKHAELHPDWTAEQAEKEFRGKMGSFYQRYNRPFPW